MAALSAKRVTLIPNGTIRLIALPLPSGKTAWTGGTACVDSSNPGVVVPGVAGSATLTPIGVFNQDLANTSGSNQLVGVTLFKEVELSYFDNVSGGGAVALANILTTGYIADDHSVTTTSSGNSALGRIWIFNAAGTGQIGVQPNGP